MIVTLTLGAEEFAARRRRAQDDAIDRLLPFAVDAVARVRQEGWADDLIAQAEHLYDLAYSEEGGDRRPNHRELVAAIRRTLSKTTADSKPENIAVWVAIAVLNAAVMQAAADDEDELFLQWVTMHDRDVRTAHKRTDGQTRPIGEPYNVDGTPMLFPGDTRAPIELWINCRCTVRPVLATEALTASTGGTVSDDKLDSYESVPWHGVLAPEDVRSGDGRKFAAGSLRHRDPPLPMSWQKASDDGHKGNVTVAKIENVEMIDGLMHAYGSFLNIPEADEVVGLLGEFGRFGVSVDADDAQFELDEETETVVFTSARVASACIVPIPAFAEAWVALGKAPWMKPEPTDEQGEPVDPSGPPSKDVEADKPAAVRDDAPPPPDLDEKEGEPRKKRPVAAELEQMRERAFRDVPTKERRDLAGEGKAMPDGSFPIANTDDLRNAIQSVGRASDPDAAKRHIKKRARALNAEGLIPDGWGSGVEAFVDVAPGRTEDGPGWLTHPVDTDRLRDYWVRGEGAAKIGWGAPGDFNRCRIQVAKYIKPQHLNGYCANRHYDALGFWPGRAPTEQGSLAASAAAALGLEHTEPAEALSLVAGGAIRAPAAWFADPKLEHLSPLTVTEDGRVFGHLAAWTSCHIGFEGMCVAPPASSTDYSYFHSGEVLLDDGTSVPVGNITIGGGHADAKLGMKAAIAHYDSTSAVAADIAVGEDTFGIWFAGWVRPGVTEEMVYALRASALSGDWRARPGKGSEDMELIAALAVNVPGFGIPRARVAASATGQISLVASGIVAPSEESAQAAASVDIEALAVAVATNLAVLQVRREKMLALAARVNGEQVSAL